MNYLELVNKGIEESGVALDPLTSIDFDSPQGSKMYTRFKTWVADSWKELQTDGKESFFSSAVVVASLRPRIRVFNLFALTAIAGKQYFDGNGNVIEVAAVGPHMSGDATLGTYKGFLDIVNLGGEWDALDLGTVWTEDTLDPDPNVFTLNSFVGYSIAEIDPTIQTLTTQPIILKIDGAENEVIHTPWKAWRHPLKNEYGVPTLYTMGPDGYLYFYPNLSEDATLVAFGNTIPQVLTQSTDVPAGLLPAYHDIIYWGAVRKYANYEGLTKLWKSADAAYNGFSIKLSRDAGLMPSWQASVYG